MSSIFWKIVISVMFLVAVSGMYRLGTNYYSKNSAEISTKQLNDNGDARKELEVSATSYSVFSLAFITSLVVFFYLFWQGELLKMYSKFLKLFVLLCITSCLIGCYRPFEPVKLEVVGTNEEAFLIPLVGDTEKQGKSNNEEFLQKNLVYTKQVKIPQQWVPLGYETLFPNGKWQEAATLIKVDKSPVTREWTADPNSGTSNKNEAIWVMTSDQVEFSTGWVCTARIASRDDAVKFLHNYPNGSLTKVLDTEVRSKIQTVFGLEVTDLPMDKLRKQATPHIENTVKTINTFFKSRGIEITNLGISGGFIYKDQSVIDTLVKVFNAEQEKAMAIAKLAAQEKLNERVVMEAKGKADAIMEEKGAEAKAIKMVAEARLFEMEKVANNINVYAALKQLELQKVYLDKWNGEFPRYFMGNGGSNPQMLLQMPQIETEKKLNK